MDVNPVELPFVCADLPPTGGEIRTVPEDFRVDEVPAYLPCGEGEHLFVTIEKRDLTTDVVARALADQLGLDLGDVGYAGQKDRHAVTTQAFSVPAPAEAALARFALEGARVLDAARHTNRLRTGHLRGNRFRIVLRGVDEEALARAQAIAGRLLATGLPNAFGPQRFGHDGDTARAGLRLLADPERGPGSRDRYKRKLYLSAVQAWLFNLYLVERGRDGLMQQMLLGDVAERTDSGGLFVVEDLEEAAPRFAAREIVHAGPIYGRKTFRATGEAAAREARLLADAGVDPRAFDAFGKLAMGTRRANLLFLADLAVEAVPEGLALAFTLPAGSYATVVLREFVRKDVR